MRVVGTAAWVCVLFCGCAVGTVTDDTIGDSGTKADASKTDSGGTKPDSGYTQPDSGYTQPDTGSTGNCGGQCLGTQSTCCSNTCVDITSDPNNCGFCGTTCGTQSCCAGNCTNTMGNDPNNCGGCGVVCNGTCSGGSCQTQTTGCTLDKGTCSHSPCTTGGALAPGCDPESVVTFVCVIDGLSSCCSSTWDSSCVSDAAIWEASSCVGQGC